MLPDTALAVILLGLVLYVVLDGHGLGGGALTLIEPDSQHRAEMVQHVSFAWDANESWLLLPAIGLFAALPGAYALVLPALYLPLFVMLFSFIARGVSIEFLAEHRLFTRGFGLLFGVGSLVAVLVQGMAIGALLHGISASDGQFTGGSLDWLSGYAVSTGLAAVALQVLSGAAWIYFRTDTDGLRRRASRWITVSLPLTVLLLALAWLLLPEAATREANGSARIPLVTVMGIVGLAAVALVALGVSQRPSARRWMPVAGVIVLKVAGGVGLATLVFPAVVPGALTVDQAAAGDSSIWFFLAAAGCTLPVVFIYNAFGYSVFGRRRHPVEGVGR